MTENRVSSGAALVACVALGAFPALAACSVAVSDLGAIPPDPEGCVQEPSLRATTRDLALVLSSMEAHGSQKTVVTMVRRRSGLTQARVIALPTGAGALGPRRLVRDDRMGADGLRCRLAEGTPLDVLVNVPNAVPPDSDNDGPYQIDFWSDLNRSGGIVQPFPDDHSWSANVCDNGQFLFAHNTGFEALTPATEAGTFRLTANPTNLLTAFAPRSPRFPAGVGRLDEQRAFVMEAVARLQQLPTVLTIERQATTVGYLVTELECLVPDAADQVTLAIPGVVDGGNFHDVQMYFDTQRNGRFDMNCDPSCRATLEQTAPDGSLTYELRDAAACNFPDGFHQTAPGEACAMIDAPTVSAFLAGELGPPSNP